MTIVYRMRRGAPQVMILLLLMAVMITKRPRTRFLAPPCAGTFSCRGIRAASVHTTVKRRDDVTADGVTTCLYLSLLSAMSNPLCSTAQPTSQLVYRFGAGDCWVRRAAWQCGKMCQLQLCNRGFRHRSFTKILLLALGSCDGKPFGNRP